MDGYDALASFGGKRDTMINNDETGIGRIKPYESLLFGCHGENHARTGLNQKADRFGPHPNDGC